MLWIWGVNMLKCVMCGKIVVSNNNPICYTVCSSCDTSELTQHQKAVIWSTSHINEGNEVL